MKSVSAKRSWFIMLCVPVEAHPVRGLPADDYSVTHRPGDATGTTSAGFIRVYATAKSKLRR
jgi:hypothetical protein